MFTTFTAALGSKHPVSFLTHGHVFSHQRDFSPRISISITNSPISFLSFLPTSTTNKACFTDLPTESRLIVYGFLLVDPMRDGNRIAFTKVTWSRSRCTQAEHPDNEINSAEHCHIDVPSFTYHHRDFTDLTSLSQVNKKIYAEASETIYNNADLVYAFGWLPFVGNT
ncbi:hypothetical protein E4T47_04497 [Aureobasidium subglaciale]|nr:hypothetical protein E4T47_04497 [Aureobasidium subglaciale]